MLLHIDTTNKEFTVTRAPGPKLDQTGQQRTGRENGQLLWTTQVCAVDESGGECITITTDGTEPPVCQVADIVVIERLLAIPYAASGRTGVTYRADNIRVDE